MDAKEFIESALKRSKKDYGLFPPPTSAQEGLSILISHFLDDDWYSMLPINQQQLNTEAIYEILKRYPKRKSTWTIIKKKLLNKHC